MSYKKVETITCFACGSKRKATLWAIVNSLENTKIKKKVVDGTIFEYKCPTCGEINFITYPMLYEDDANKFMVYYAGSLLEIAEAQQIIDKRRSNIKSSDDNIIRIVNSPNALSEKVRLLEENIDDRVIEIMKVILLDNVSKKKLAEHVDEVLCSIRPDGDFDFDFLGERPGSLLVKRDFYKYVEDKCKKFFKNQDENPTEVNIDWAIEFIEKYHFVCR